jgi:ketosteroid isomerase-like protein
VLLREYSLGSNWKGMPHMEPFEIVNSFYEALGRSDLRDALALLDDSVEWTEAEKSPYYSGTWIGPAAVLQHLFEPISREWEHFRVTADSFVVEGSIVVAFGMYSGTYKATGKSLSAPFAHRWQVVEGTIMCFRQYTDTALMAAVIT